MEGIAASVIRENLSYLRQDMATHIDSQDANLIKNHEICVSEV